MKPESVSAMVYGANIMLNRLKIIFNYIIYAFVKRAVLSEEEVHNSGTGYIDS